MKRKIESFDYMALAKKYNIDSDTLDNIIKETYNEFPHDEMLAELHVIRALKAIRRRYFLC
jgi:hypothetical protein